ncbi:MAG: amidohydrolase family protein [Opitutae bacterium]|nr:amidohydrolase family protein [Opitutae bacterium]
MKEIKLHHKFNYTDVDRAFWAKHLEDWVPQRVYDSHIHIIDQSYQLETVSEEMKKSYWVQELQNMLSADVAGHCYQTVFPGRDVCCTGFGWPFLGWEIEGSNEYVWTHLPAKKWNALAVVRPTWVAEQVEWLLSHPGVIGVKPYYSLIGHDASSRDKYIEASIFDFLPHHQLEVLNDHKAWVTMHVPKADRLGHPENQRDIKEIRNKYPDIRLVIAHFGRSYTKPHAEEGILPLADDPGLYWDNSAVLNPEVHALAMEHIGPDRIMYGTDNPMFMMRGRRKWQGRSYTNHTSQDFYFNTNRESPEIEAGYTLYMYEALKAMKDACEKIGIGRDGVEKMFFRNADRLVADIEAHRDADK